MRYLIQLPHRRERLFLTLLAFNLVLALAGASELPKSGPTTRARTAQPSHLSPAAEDADTTYVRDVLPILMGRCSRCHNGQSSLPNWMDYKIAFTDRHEIKRRIWDSWKGAYYKQSMPAGNSQECALITEQERNTLKSWVLEGGAYGVLAPDTPPKSKQERMERGQKIFAMVCAACHQSNGQGIPDKFPPLAGSDFLNADKTRAIKTLINGRQGEIVVNGRKFNNSMPSLPLVDEDIASALTFVYNSFGNCGKTVTPEEIKSLRGQPDTDAPAQPREVAHAVEPKSEFE
jgi:mono/diheme cytochrome c family protein